MNDGQDVAKAPGLDLYRSSFEANCSTEKTTLLITKFANYSKEDGNCMKTLDKVSKRVWGVGR